MKIAMLPVPVCRWSVLPLDEYYWRTSHLIGTSLASSIATLCGEHKKMMMTSLTQCKSWLGCTQWIWYWYEWHEVTRLQSPMMYDWDHEYTSILRAREQKKDQGCANKTDKQTVHILFSHFVARFGWPSNPNPFCQSGTLAHRDSATGLLFIFPVLGKWANDV